MQKFTQRLLLREFTPFDTDAIAVLSAKNGFSFYSLDGTKEGATQFVQTAIDLSRPANGMARNGFKIAVTTRKEQGACIGYVAVDNIFGDNGSLPDIGYLIDPDQQQKGFATEAMGGLLNHVYQTFPHLDGITLTVHPDNIASQKVAAKLSFARVSDDVQNYAYGPRYNYATNRARLMERSVIRPYGQG